MIQIEINKDLKKKFEDDGYLILPQFLDTNKIDSIADKFANLFSGIFVILGRMKLSIWRD
mgnify:CR=1 FL=1